MKKIHKTIGAILVLLSISISCDLDQDLVDPNEISVDGADVNYIMNGIMLDFADFYSYASGNSVDPSGTNFGPDRLMRMRAMTTGYRYQTAAQAQYVDDTWEWAYSKVLVNIETVVPLLDEKKLTTQAGIARILKAYTYLTLVDLFGEIPASEALQGPVGNFNPVADPGENTYNTAIALLGEARTELAKTGADAGAAMAAGADNYYGGNRAAWLRLANTLEFKAQLNLSIIPARAAEASSRIDALIAEGNLIGIAAGSTSFTYKYGTAIVPYSKHPLYRQYYQPTEGSATGYICNSFLKEIYDGKGVEDPRWRYYFYRQVGSIARANAVDPKSVGCTEGAPPNHYVTGGYEFCTFDPGFYGRDHGDASGTPPDGQVLTCTGAYPSGGRTDTNSTVNVDYYQVTKEGQGGNGAGIEPIFMTSFTDYMIAEYYARKGDNANAKTFLLSAITKSINEVKAFCTSIGQTVPANLQPSTTAYTDAVGAMFDAAANKVKVVGREFYAASYGNGIEAYNIYRRTSAPDNMQPTLQINPGPFLRSLVYPAIYVNLNSNATQKDYDATNKVFWDTNPDVLN
ncbi:MAG TPA: SusD/RagB family nutrient-binding outer membrane lipoprotein [Chryseolinea sp.]|nr:SusD/RagB family nutrient-binding outer membrane lipoprotein [Chryseolinea sp.]